MVKGDKSEHNIACKIFENQEDNNAKIHSKAKTPPTLRNPFITPFNNLKVETLAQRYYLRGLLYIKTGQNLEHHIVWKSHPLTLRATINAF